MAENLPSRPCKTARKHPIHHPSPISSSSFLHPSLPPQQCPLVRTLKMCILSTQPCRQLSHHHSSTHPLLDPSQSRIFSAARQHLLSTQSRDLSTIDHAPRPTELRDDATSTLRLRTHGHVNLALSGPHALTIDEIPLSLICDSDKALSALRSPSIPDFTLDFHVRSVP